MKKKITVGSIVIAGSLLASCASFTASEDKCRLESAKEIGVPASQIEISNKEIVNMGNHVKWHAKTTKGEYKCFADDLFINTTCDRI